MIKIILLIILCVIFYYLFKKIEHYQNLNEFYKLNELIDSGDDSKKFSFTIEKIKLDIGENEFVDTASLNNEEISNKITYNTEDLQDISLDSKDLSIVSSSSNIFTINFTDNNLTLKKNSNIIIESPSYELNLTSPGEYHFDCENDFMVEKELIINIDSDNIVINGKNIFINLSNRKNIKGIFKNGSSNKNGRNNVVIKNMHFIYKGDIDASLSSSSDQSQTGSNNPPNGGGGICMDYFGRDAKNNIISDCYVYKSNFVVNSGGIVGQYAGHKGGELIIMNCVLNGHDMENIYGNFNSQMRNTGGICGPYLGEDGGKVLVYNCSNYASFMNKGCSGIVGSNAANKNSNVVLFCCSNFGRMSMKDNCSGLVGSNSCKDSSNLSIICCYCLEDNSVSYSNTYAPFIGYNSVLNKSNLNIVMCYNSLQIDYQDNVSKYFVASTDSLTQSVTNNDGNANNANIDSSQQKAQQQRDNDSSILMDYCFNSTISTNFNNTEIAEKEFGSNLSNITVKNSGKIDLTFGGDNSNTLFSNSLSNYTISFNDINNNEFPYNNIFSSHLDKLMYLGNNYESLFTSVVSSSVNLKQYFDDNLQNENCIYTSNSSIYTVYYRLKHNIIYTSCINDNMTLDQSDSKYNSLFSQNVDFNLCKNQSLQNCDEDKCVFKTFYKSVRCYPKDVNNNKSDDDAVSLGRQLITCFNLNPMQCENNNNCSLGPKNICINKT